MIVAFIYKKRKKCHFLSPNYKPILKISDKFFNQIRFQDNYNGFV